MPSNLATRLLALSTPSPTRSLWARYDYPFLSILLLLLYCITNLSQQTYKLTLTNVPDGVDTLVNAKPPVGVLNISGTWRVADGKLSEEIEIDANFMMKKVVKSNVEKTHPEQHMKLLEAAHAWTSSIMT
jgi:hypothetical protein